MIREEIKNKIIQMRVEGYPVSSIVKDTHVSDSTVRKICSNAGLKFKVPDADKVICDYSKLHDLFVADTEIVKLQLEKYSCGKLEYVTGYVTSDSKITVKCKECGHIFQRSFVSIRQRKKYMGCPNCLKTKKEEDLRTKKEEAEARAVRAKAISTARQEEKYNRTHHTVICCECGKAFKGTNKRKFCSADCRKKHNNILASRRKDARIDSSHIIDRNISLSSLYTRDNGICYLCGKQCDYNDITITENGIFIAGNNYPSIDHVIPIAKGGYESWNNVRLACRRCNSLKSDKIIPARYSQPSWEQLSIL